MKLREILPADADVATPDADAEVGGVSADSRVIKRGDVFVAIEGGKTDGLNFVGAAIAAGAVAVVAQRHPDTLLPAAVNLVKVGNARRALALMATKFFPRQPQTIAMSASA